MMKDKQVQQILALLQKLEKELKLRQNRAIPEAETSANILEKNFNFEQNLKILQDCLDLQGKLIYHDSKRKILGPVINKIRGKFYREMDQHLQKTLQTQELFNLHVIKAINSLQVEIAEIKDILKNDGIQGNKESLHEPYTAIRRESDDAS